MDITKLPGIPFPDKNCFRAEETFAAFLDRDELELIRFALEEQVYRAKDQLAKPDLSDVMRDVYTSSLERNEKLKVIIRDYIVKNPAPQRDASDSWPKTYRTRYEGMPK